MQSDIEDGIAVALSVAYDCQLDELALVEDEAPFRAELLLSCVFSRESLSVECVVA